MQLRIFNDGPLGANMYLFWNEGSYIIVDPCCEVSSLDSINDIPGFDRNSLVGVYMTHGHFDHIYMVDDWKSNFPDVPFYMDKDDFCCLTDPSANCSHEFRWDLIFGVEPIDSSSNPAFKAPCGFTCKALKTPGHSEGSTCFIFESNDEKLMFSGDMLFSGSVGRTDFYRGDTRKMLDSIKILSNLQDDYVVFPGHGGSTKLSIEKKSNPYFIY